MQLTDYQRFIHASRYARWLENENRRETWGETVDRYFSFMVSHLEKQGYKPNSKIVEELREAVFNRNVMPSMRSVMTAGAALDRENVSGYNCAFLPVDNARSFVDAMMSIPWILMVMLFVAALGSNSAALVPVLGFSYGLSVVYLARAAALDFVARDFVVAAQIRGHARWSIALTELLPNVRDSLAVQGAMQWSWILLAVSSLSFLGMGVAPPTPDWGQMIADARGIMQRAPWALIWPMLALSSLVIGMNLAVDAWARATGVDRNRRVPGA